MADQPEIDEERLHELMADFGFFSGMKGLKINGRPAMLPGLDPEKIGGAVARAAAAYVRDPENLAGFSGSVLLPVLVISRGGRRLPFLPWLMLALMGDAAGRLAWRSYKNLEIIAQAHQPAPDDA